MNRRRASTIILLIIGAFILYGVHNVFQPFYKSILWAVIIGVTFHPVYNWIHRRSGIRASFSSIIVVTIIILFFLIPAIMIIRSLITQIAYVYDALQPLVPDFIDKISPYLPGGKGETLKETILNNLKDVGRILISYMSSATGNVISMFFQTAVTVIMLFFIFRDGEALLEKIRRSALIPYRDIDVFIGEAGSVIRAVIYGVILTAMIQGILGGMGFWILGLPAPVLFGTIMFILAIIPFVGTPVVWLPASLWLMYNHMVGKGIFLMLWGFLAVSLIDNFLRPYFISRRLGFHALLTFIGIVGGMMSFGFVGIFLGPLLLSLSLRLFEMYFRMEE